MSVLAHHSGLHAWLGIIGVLAAVGLVALLMLTSSVARNLSRRHHVAASSHRSLHRRRKDAS